MIKRFFIILLAIVSFTQFVSAQTGDWPAGSLYTYFGATGMDHSNSANYAALQDKTNGRTFLNSPLEIRFRIGNTDKMFLSNGGSFGINTLSPTAKFHVVGTGGTTVDMIVNGRIKTGDGTYNGGLWVDSGGTMLMGQSSSTQMGFYNGGAWRMIVNNNGNIGIGTSSPDQKLTVNGTIHGTRVKVDATVPVPDYVFEKDYLLPSLEQIKSFIDENKHLPDVPSAKEMETNGIDLGEMNMLLLKKLEELTLYVIELKTEVEALKKTKGLILKSNNLDAVIK